MQKSYESLTEKLCYYDSRNPNHQEGEMKEDCYCDNCFYGRTPLANALIQAQQPAESQVLNLFKYLNKVAQKNAVYDDWRVEGFNINPDYPSIITICLSEDNGYDGANLLFRDIKIEDVINRNPNPKIPI